MNAQDLINKVAELPPRPADVPTRPPLELIAMVVRWGRDILHWKASTLADFAEVSLSTIERVERAERVSDDALRHIAIALGHAPDAFTAPRIPLGEEAASADLVERYGHLEPVAVAPLKTQKAVRDAARCDGLLVHRPGVPDSFDAQIACLAEWLDLVSFVLSDVFGDAAPPERGRRDLYNDVLGFVAELESNGLTVLSGIHKYAVVGMPDMSVAVLSITLRSADPGAIKRSHVMVDRRNLRPAGWVADI